MKNSLLIIFLFSFCIFVSCSTENEQEPPPLSIYPGDEEGEVEERRYKFVITNKVEETLYLIKHIVVKEKLVVQYTDTLEYGQSSKLKGTNADATTIKLRWSSKTYPENICETIRTLFIEGYPNRFINTTLKEGVYNFEVIVKE